MMIPLLFPLSCFGTDIEIKVEYIAFRIRLVISELYNQLLRTRGHKLPSTLVA